MTVDSIEEFSDELRHQACAEALDKVIAVLTLLDPMERERVVRTTCVFLEIARREE